MKSDQPMDKLEHRKNRSTAMLGILIIALFAYGCASSNPKIIKGKDYNSEFEFYYSAQGDTIRHGLLTGYFTEVDGAAAENDGKIRWTSSYVDGEVEGVETVYYVSGEPKTETSYVAGIQEGISRYYYKDGLVSFATWSAGIKEGPFKTIYKGGATASGAYRQGKWDGKIKTIKANGETELATFSSGVKHGPSSGTTADGGSFRMHFVDGEAHGLVSIFDMDDNLILLRGFWQDELVYNIGCTGLGASEKCSNLVRTDQVVMELRYKSHVLFGEMFGVKFHISQRQVGFCGADVVYVEGIDPNLKDILTEEYETGIFRFSFKRSNTPNDLQHLGILYTLDEGEGMNPKDTDYLLQKIELVSKEGTSLKTIASTQ